MEIRDQRLEIDLFQGHLESELSIIAAASGGGADLDPSGRLVASARKAVALDKSLDQMNRMPVFVPPVRR